MRAVANSVSARTAQPPRSGRNGPGGPLDFSAKLQSWIALRPETEIQIPCRTDWKGRLRGTLFSPASLASHSPHSIISSQPHGLRAESRSKLRIEKSLLTTSTNRFHSKSFGLQANRLTQSSDTARGCNRDRISAVRTENLSSNHWRTPHSSARFRMSLSPPRWPAESRLSTLDPDG